MVCVSHDGLLEPLWTMGATRQTPSKFKPPTPHIRHSTQESSYCIIYLFVCGDVQQAENVFVCYTKPSRSVGILLTLDHFKTLVQHLVNY